MQIRVCYERKAENSFNRLPVFLDTLQRYLRLRKETSDLTI